VPKPLVTYQFEIMTQTERESFLTSLDEQSYEAALLEAKMLRFDRRPRFSQAFRSKVEADARVIKSIRRDEHTYIWLEDAPGS
jgi:hypothetical protein